MIIPRAVYNATPPERRTRIANNPTLLYSWWCTIFSAVIIGIRVSGRYIRNERLFREDKIMAWSIIPLLARMGCVHVVLIWGTNNADVSHLTDPVKIRHRQIGSQLVLAARIFFALLYVYQFNSMVLTNVCPAYGRLSSPCLNSSNALRNASGREDTNEVCTAYAFSSPSHSAWSSSPPW
jgi:hypothetical protein